MPARDKKPLEGCEKPNTALRHDTGGADTAKAAAHTQQCGRPLMMLEHRPRAYIPEERNTRPRINYALGAEVSSGRLFLAISTSALKAAGSFTASSASIRRSTSTPAAFRPWMKRL